ncbi:Transcriptional regulator TetR family [Patulibacter medicamentivorans]|uniref:Transcriptional regulator TetR family n=1 Tax=Patulibacter medicamentivorans TaxID=1097667 RepID=H0E0C4_9ACTN|nr:TetR/AcrR family transcriptional regulator [Patulibacter medicamentivorans]EHN12927.1 Transcriptional regulator TetR family [Patulibacter medicamentivorans]
MSFSASIAHAGVLEPGRKSFSPRQQEVLDVVERVFLREGIRAVRMAKLADEAQCSRSTLYELAASKEDLLLLVLDRMMRRTVQRAGDAIREAPGPVDQVRAMLTSGALGFSALGPNFLDAIRGYPPARLLFDRWIAVGRDALERMIDEAVRAREFRPVNAAVVAEGMFAVVMRFTDPEFARSTRVSASDGLAQLVDVLLDGLRPRS